MVNELIKNRDRFFNKMRDNSMLILHSGYKIHKSADAEYPFVVNNNFFYLTGIDQANVILMISKVNGIKRERIFIENVDLKNALWVGETLSHEEVNKISGVDENNIFDIASFYDFLASSIQPGRYTSDIIETIYLDLEQCSLPLYNTFALDLATYIKSKFPHIDILSSYLMLIEQRMVKNEKEIDLIKASIETTKEAIYGVMNKKNELVSETIANSYHDFYVNKAGKKISFDSIIASGHNGTILHYVANNQEIKKDSLVLMDVGCYTNHYSSDISRTFPVSGKFTKRQKEVYEIVLDVNKKCIAFAKAGITWKDLNDYANSLLIEGLKKLGLITKDEDFRKYYYHGIGHSLGLDVHDPSIRRLGLVEGMVITIEPGLYIEEESIGIRIEDNIVITKNDAIVLSKDIIKEVKDIEEFMK